MRATSFLFALLGTASAECPNACSGHGDCGVFDQCSCYRNFQGNDCSERTCPFGHAHVDSPKGDLNMDGGALSGPFSPVVINSEVYPLGTTEQYPDALANEAHFYMECSNKGLCDRKSGECECFDGYDGSSCQRASCPGGIGGDSEQCSGHGTCHSISYLSEFHSSQKLPLTNHDGVSYKLWDAGYTRGCQCDAPFSGADCAERECKFGVDPLYRSTGTALYQKAFVANACNHADVTTNGIVHEYASGLYTAVMGASHTAVVTIATDALPGWAANLKGQEIILVDPANLNSIGCRQRVVGASFSTTDTSLNVVSSDNGDAFPLKCDSSGVPVDAASYDVYFVENTFTLLFTDHHGEVYRTAPISAAVADYSAEVKAALEGLPNQVVSNVAVTAAPFNTNDISTIRDEMGYHIDFWSNPGTLGELKIDSTPIRLGQKLVAGIECKEDTVYVDSKVGYREIGEDWDKFDDYVGNIAYFNRQTVLDGVAASVADGETSSGLENNIVYTSTSLVGVVAAGSVIKIQNEVYVVDYVNSQHIALNTHYKGSEVLSTGSSTQIFENDNTGAAVGDGTVGLSYVDDTHLSLVAFEYSTPSTEDDGTKVYTARTDGFSANDRVRVTHSDATTGYIFDCIFSITSATVDGTNTPSPSGGNHVDGTNSFNYDLVVTDVDRQCPTLKAAATALGTDLSVNIYTFVASTLTNGQYADTTRIFKSAHTTHVHNNDAAVTARLGAVDIVVASDVNSWLSAGDVVIIENEWNLVEGISVDGLTVTLKNAYANEDSHQGQSVFYERSVIDGSNPDIFTGTVDGYNVERLYKVNVADPASSNYNYVSQCSNRGLCDGSSGLCKCFKGYTGDSCDSISELYG